ATIRTRSIPPFPIRRVLLAQQPRRAATTARAVLKRAPARERESRLRRRIPLARFRRRRAVREIRRTGRSRAAGAGGRRRGVYRTVALVGPRLVRRIRESLRRSGRVRI